jgi:predicted AAA+ superfamily ATPase
MATPVFKRDQFDVLKTRLEERRRFIQVLAGPRQSGKSTLARQVADSLDAPVMFVSADDPEARGRAWLELQWGIARIQAREAGKNGSVLIVDEIQKISTWSEQIKRLWDEDSASKLSLKVVVLGSAPLLIQKGLTESLTGRFEVVRLTHWSFSEMKSAFGWNLDQYVFFGGYPGAADLIQDEERWKRYILDSMIETTLSRDLLQLNRIDKPALLRQLFTLGCSYSGQILSYTKLVGQLQDAGNTTTLAHYLELLGSAGMLIGLHKYAGQKVRQRGSSPKFVTLNNAFISAQSELGLEQAKEDPAYWGRLVESAVGAHLVNEARSGGYEIYYWREGEREVDYVVKKGKSLSALEVKSGRDKGSRSGMDVFSKLFRPKQVLLVGTGGITLSQLLGNPIRTWIS